MNMRIGRPDLTPDLDPNITGKEKVAPQHPVGSEPGVTIEHDKGHHHHGGLPQLDIDDLLPPPQPNALNALLPTTTTDDPSDMPAMPAMPAMPSMPTMPDDMPTMPTMPDMPAMPAMPAMPDSGGDSSNSDLTTKAGPSTTNSLVAIMLEVGLTEIQSDQDMAKSQDESRRSDLASYVSKMNDAIQNIQNQADDEKTQAWIEGVVGGVGAALSLAGSVMGPFAAADGAGFKTMLFGGTELGAGLLSTSGDLLGKVGDAISSGTAGVAEKRQEGYQQTNQMDAGIYQSAESSAQEYRDKYWDFQDKALSAIQSYIQGQGQALQAAASNI